MSCKLQVSSKFGKQLWVGQNFLYFTPLAIGWHSSFNYYMIHHENLKKYASNYEKLLVINIGQLRLNSV